MTYVFHADPPKPKCVFIWDIEKVLSYLNNLPMTKEISDRFLLVKLTTLPSLTSAGRGHEIRYLNVFEDMRKCICRGKSLLIVHFSKVTKFQKRSKYPPKGEFCKFPTTCEPCVVFRLETWRSLGEKGQVLLRLDQNGFE